MAVRMSLKLPTELVADDEDPEEVADVSSVASLPCDRRLRTDDWLEVAEDCP
jgi:hypothetical protein